MSTQNELIIPATVQRTSSFGSMLASEGIESKVMVIYTGGTIGMVRNLNNVLEPIPNAFEKKIRQYPNMHDEKYAIKRFGCGTVACPLVLPPVQELEQSRRIVYTIVEYNPLLDSSNMTMADWVRIAEDIRQSYESFDGFVILHGTDTLSYTASALSFMLENLGKTVIITGSQIPIFDTRNDGMDNFTASLIAAGGFVIPEVCVLFNSKLMRGNRTTKISANALDAFDSPNVPAIGRIGIRVEIDYRLIFRPCTVSKFSLHSTLDENVGIFRIFPSVTKSAFKSFLQPPMKGVVLQTFGSGNVPSNRDDLMLEIKEATKRGVIIINCTQCLTGSVAEIYETGQILADLGVLSGYDMTPESALTKLAYVLSKDWTLETKKQMLITNIRGELSHGKPLKMEECDLVEAVARSLHLSSPRELDQLGYSLFPAMVNSTVLSGNIQKLENLKNFGANLCGVNYDRRTALHVACSEKNVEVVKYLLLNGVSVHLRDRYDRTPLMDAISNDNHEIIRLLMKCGAHLTGSARSIGDELCKAAARGFLVRLKSFQLAKVDLGQCDFSERTALHLAALHQQLDIVVFLLENDVPKEKTDLLGLTAIDYAVKSNHKQIIDILNS